MLSYAFLQSVFATSPLGIAVADGRTEKLMYANDVFLSMFGYTQEQLCQMKVTELHPVYARPQVIRHFSEMGKGDLSDAREIPCLKKDGTIFYCDIHPGTTVIDGKSALLAYFTDVTAGRSARLANEYLRDSLLRSQRMAKLGSWELDLVTNQLYWSPEVFNIFEIDSTKFHASYDAFLSLIHPDDRGMVNEAYILSLQTKQPYAVVHRLQMPDGRIKWVEEQCETEYDPVGTPLVSRGTVQDITERYLHERAIEQSLTEKMLLQREIAHRVKNNLQIMSSLLQMQAAEGVQPEMCGKMREMVGRIETMALVQNEMLRQGNAASIRFAEYASQLFHQTAALHNVEHISLRCTGQGELTVTHAIPLALMLHELISNSLRHAFHGREQGEVSVHIEDDGTIFTLHYADDGCGFDVAKLEESETLGMLFLRELTAQIDGKITAESGNGTRYTIRFSKETACSYPPAP